MSRARPLKSPRGSRRLFRGRAWCKSRGATISSATAGCRASFGGMLTNTAAYLRLRKRVQETIDFAVLTCHAVPALNGYMKSVEKSHESAAEGKKVGKLPDPDYFGLQEHSALRKIKPNYRKMLGRMMLLSAFSYFENYIQAAVQELLDFHGGGDALATSLKARNLAAIAVEDVEQEHLRRKLNEPMKADFKQRYASAQAKLASRGYRFPSDLLASFGAKQLITRLKAMKAVEIPELLDDGLLFSMGDEKRAEFSRIRENRNRIAHGDDIEIDLSSALDANRFLKRLAQQIDAHIVRHFMIVEFFP